VGAKEELDFLVADDWADGFHGGSLEDLPEGLDGGDGTEFAVGERQSLVERTRR
jgi:hypothetical protein